MVDDYPEILRPIARAYGVEAVEAACDRALGIPASWVSDFYSEVRLILSALNTVTAEQGA